MTRRRLSINNASKIMLVGATVGVISAWIASQNNFATWETRFLQTIYDLPSTIGPVAYVITQFGSISAVLIIGLISFFIISKKVALEVWVSGLVAYGFAGLLKLAIDRPRPSGLIQGIIQRYEVAAGPGYPSGHAAVSSALAMTLWFVIPKKHRWLLVAWGLAVSLSRMYLGLHAPLDILGGISIGLFVAAAVQVFFTRYLYRSRKSTK